MSTRSTTTGKTVPRHVTPEGVEASRDWKLDGVCTQHHPDLWFPHDAQHKQIREAVALCQTCPVIDQCLQFALDSEPGHYRHGIYGGLTPAQRTALVRRNRRKTAA